MNILFLAQRVPYPPNKGDKTRAFHELKYLSRNHRISLVCLADDRQDLEYAPELKPYCHSVDIVFQPRYRSTLHALRSLGSRAPFTRAHFYSKKLQALVDRKIKATTYDMIFVYCSSMAQYVEQVRQIPKVIDFVDVDSEKWAQYAQYAKFPQKIVYRMESRRLRTYERWLANTFQHGFFVSAKEVRDFRQLVAPNAPLTPILLGVDTDTFAPTGEPYDARVLIFTGSMDYFANVETMRYFSLAIFPQIQNVIPDVKLYIVGRNPTADIVKLGQTNPQMIVTGAVAHVQPYLRQAAVFVAPMRISRGVQTKILEAMAMGVPVVTNSLAYEALTAEAGQDLFVEDQPERFAQQVLRLMTEPALRNTIASNARQAIMANYNWEKNLATLEEILAEVGKRP